MTDVPYVLSTLVTYALQVTLANVQNVAICLETALKLVTMETYHPTMAAPLLVL